MKTHALPISVQHVDEQLARLLLLLNRLESSGRTLESASLKMLQQSQGILSDLSQGETLFVVSKLGLSEQVVAIGNRTGVVASWCQIVMQRCSIHISAIKRRMTDVERDLQLLRDCSAVLLSPLGPRDLTVIMEPIEAEMRRLLEQMEDAHAQVFEQTAKIAELRKLIEVPDLLKP